MPHEPSLAEQFIEQTRLAAIATGGTRADFGKWAGHKLQDLVAVPPDQRDCVWMSHVISRVTPCVVSSSVSARICDYQEELNTKQESYGKYLIAVRKFPELMRPQYPVMFLEWDQRLSDDNTFKAGLLIVPPVSRPGQSEFTAYMFFKIPTEKEGRSLIYPVHSRQPIIGFNYYPAFSDTNTQIELFSSGEFPQGKKIEWQNAHHASVALIFLKTRASVLKIDNFEDGSSFSRQRIRDKMRKGSPVNLKTGEVTWDVSRILAKGHAKTKAEAIKLLEEQTVSGHPKHVRVRKRDPEGNLLPGYERRWAWIAPYFRGGTEEQKEMRQGMQPLTGQRAARAVLRRPDRPLAIPVLDDG